MKITDTTPKPLERTFTIELTENEFKNIALIVGTSIPHTIQKMVEENHHNVQYLGGNITYISTVRLYSEMRDAITDE